ncbi:hypothetical protein FJY69_10025, partial [candidate division WOR-3 bacterium]|nr:hypothetical protein [candidate division WOR-3 bacterium]
ARVSIIEQSSAGTTFEITLPGIEATPESTEAGWFQRLGIGGAVPAMLANGKPEVPVIPVLLAIPNGASVYAQVTVKETRTFKVGDVLPQQPPLRGDEEPGPFRFDQAAYSVDAAYPGTDFIVVEPATWRDLEVANVRVYPVQVNAAKDEIVVATRLQVRVDYAGGAYPSVVADWMLPRYGRFVDNFAKLPVRPLTDYQQGVRCLVFTHPTFAANPWLTDSLLGWIRKRGYEFRVISKSSFTQSEVRDSIDNEYDQHSPPLLRWAMLVGEAEHIPLPSWTHDTFTMRGDWWYSELSGDNYPELGISRFSVMSTQDLESQMWKVLRYQRCPPAADSWLNRMLLVAHWNDSDTWRFPRVIRGCCAMPLAYHAHARDTLMGYRDNNVDLANALNAGRGVAVYQGHGNAWQWASWTQTGWPSWDVNDVMALSNGDRTPVVYQFSCDNSDITQDTCISEAWLRKCPGGGVAALGAAVHAWNLQNWGMCSTAIRATGDTWHIDTLTGTLNCPVFDIGGIKTFLDAYDAKYWWPTTYYLNSWVYIFLGDPTMPVWSGGIPVVPVVTKPAYVPLGDSYTINVTVRTGDNRPVELALVCAAKGSEVYTTAYTNWLGVAKLKVCASTSGLVHLTISEGHAQHGVAGASHT